MMSTQIKPYCQTCKVCKTPDQFNLTPRKTYRYLCKVCDIEREKAKVLYEETKQKLEEQQQYQKQLSEKDYLVFHCPYENCNMLNIVYNNEIQSQLYRQMLTEMLRYLVQQTC